MKTRITEMLGIEYPIIQGGMAWVAEHNRIRSRRFRTDWRCQCTGGSGARRDPQGQRADR